MVTLFSIRSTFMPVHIKYITAIL